MKFFHGIGLALDRSILRFDAALGRLISLIRERLPNSTVVDDPPKRYGGAPVTAAEFYRARLVTAPGANLSATELYEAYCDWCDSIHRDPLALPSFGREFADLGVTKTRVDGKVRYQDIALKPGFEPGEPIRTPTYQVDAA